MSNYYEVVGVSSGGKLLEKAGMEEGIRTIPVEMTRKITPLKDLKALLQLYRIIKKEQPFIVHTHTPKAGILGMLASKLAGVPHRLHTIAGMPLLEAEGIKRWVLDQVEKLTYACATKVYPNSKGLYQIALENKYTVSSKLKVLANGSSNGINTSHFNTNIYTKKDKQELKSSLNIKASDFVFIYVGRLVADKGINELMQAFHRFSLENKNVKLLLVGTYEKDLDPLLEQTEEIIRDCKQVIAVGWQNDVRPYFAISDCLVFPSYREGFPNVVMQAGAMGLYSIVTDINGCNEIILDGVNGVMVPPKDIEALYQAMMRCLLNKDQLLSSKEKYRTMIQDRFEQEFVWNKILKEYKSLEDEQHV